MKAITFFVLAATLINAGVLLSDAGVLALGMLCAAIGEKYRRKLVFVNKR